MAALTDLSDIVHRMTGGSGGNPEHLFFFKDSRILGVAAPATIAGRMHSLWQYQGSLPHGDAPGAASVPDNLTVGALRFTPAVPPRQKWLLGVAGVNFSAGSLILYDRLLHCGGLSGIVTTPQAVGGALTRHTSGLGNQIWVEIYTSIGTTITTISANYIDDMDVARVTPLAVIGGTGFRDAARIINLSLAAGSRGVKSVTSVTLTASTGTAGNFGVTIAHQLTVLPMMTVGVGGVRDFISGLPGILPINAHDCIAMAWHALGTTAPVIHASLHFIEK